MNSGEKYANIYPWIQEMKAELKDYTGGAVDLVKHSTGTKITCE